MASSIFPSFRQPATSGANSRDCFRAAEYASILSIITPMDHADIMAKTMMTDFATGPDWIHMDLRSKPISPSSSVSASRFSLKRSIGDSPPIVQISIWLDILTFYSSSTAEVEVDGYLGNHLDRLAIQQSRLVLPLFHGVKRGLDEQRMPVDHTQILHASLLVNDRLQNHDALNARLLGEGWI